MVIFVISSFFPASFSYFWFVEHVVAQGLTAKKNSGEEIDEDDEEEEEEEEEEEDKFRDTDSPEIQQQRRLVRYLRVETKL